MPRRMPKLAQNKHAMLYVNEKLSHQVTRPFAVQLLVVRVPLLPPLLVPTRTRTMRRMGTDAEPIDHHATGQAYRKLARRSSPGASKLCGQRSSRAAQSSSIR